MLLVIGRVQCSAENRDQLIPLLEKMQDNSRKEGGCIRYGFFAAVQDPKPVDSNGAQQRERSGFGVNDALAGVGGK